MIRHKGQSSQAKHERYPAIIIFFGKSHQSAETRESQRKRPCAKNRRNDCRSPFCLQARFTGKSLFFHVLPVTARLVLRANPCFSRFARNHPSCFTGKSQFSTFCRNRTSCFTGKYLFFHVLPVIENFAKSSVAHRRLAKQLRICSTRPPSA